MIWRVASLAVMLFLGASSLLAAECDCTDEDCADLTDLENLVNGLIIAFGLPAALSPAGADAGETIRKTMGNGMPYTWIENAVNTLPAGYMCKSDKATTKYRDADINDGWIWGVPGDWVINPCVLLCGECVGSDKLGHFFFSKDGITLCSSVPKVLPPLKHGIEARSIKPAL